MSAMKLTVKTIIQETSHKCTEKDLCQTLAN